MSEEEVRAPRPESSVAGVERWVVLEIVPGLFAIAWLVRFLLTLRALRSAIRARPSEAAAFD